MSFLGGLTRITNSKGLLASSEASLKNIADLHVSESMVSIDSAIDSRPLLIIIVWSISSLSYSSFLFSFSALTQLAFSIILLESSRSCHTRLRLLPRFLGFVFCTALAPVAQGLSTAAVGSCSDSEWLLF